MGTDLAKLHGEEKMEEDRNNKVMCHHDLRNLAQIVLAFSL